VRVGEATADHDRRSIDGRGERERGGAGVALAHNDRCGLDTGAAVTIGDGCGRDPGARRVVMWGRAAPTAGRERLRRRRRGVAPVVRATLSVAPSPQLIATACVSSASVSVKLTESVAAPPSATALAASVRSAGAWLLGRTTRLALELPAALSRSVTVALTVTG